MFPTQYISYVRAQVAKRHLSFNKPTIDYTTLSNEGDQICEGVEEEMDEDDRAKAPQQQNRHHNNRTTTTDLRGGGGGDG